MAKDSGNIVMKVNNNVVSIKEEKPLLGTELKASNNTDFASDEFMDKKIKKFSINTMINQKDGIK